MPCIWCKWTPQEIHVEILEMYPDRDKLSDEEQTNICNENEKIFLAKNKS